MENDQNSSTSDKDKIPKIMAVQCSEGSQNKSSRCVMPQIIKFLTKTPMESLSSKTVPVPANSSTSNLPQDVSHRLRVTVYKRVTPPLSTATDDLPPSPYKILKLATSSKMHYDKSTVNDDQTIDKCSNDSASNCSTSSIYGSDSPRELSSIDSEGNDSDNVNSMELGLEDISTPPSTNSTVDTDVISDETDTHNSTHANVIGDNTEIVDNVQSLIKPQTVKVVPINKKCKYKIEKDTALWLEEIGSFICDEKTGKCFNDGIGETNKAVGNFPNEASKKSMSNSENGTFAEPATIAEPVTVADPGDFAEHDTFAEHGTSPEQDTFAEHGTSPEEGTFATHGITSVAHGTSTAHGTSPEEEGTFATHGSSTKD